MKTGPQKYPGASDKYRFDEAYPGSPMETNVIGWHSTEGTTLPGYRGGADAPNLTVVPDFVNKRAIWYQHHDFDSSSRAAVNLVGGVETNTANLCQVEIVGTCDPRTHEKWTEAGRKHLYMPELPDWFMDDLADFAAWANLKHGVKLQSGLTFKPYPASYGTRAQNGVRLTGDAWSSFYGHCAHMHIPENLHGDVGAFKIAKLLSLAITKANAATAPKPVPTAPKPEKPKYEPFPGAGFFKDGRKSPIVKACRARLIAVGCDRYASASNPDVWGSGDRASYKAWQKKRGFSGDDADGVPGETTWDDLKVPNV